MTPHTFTLNAWGSWAISKSTTTMCPSLENRRLCKTRIFIRIGAHIGMVGAQNEAHNDYLGLNKELSSKTSHKYNMDE